MPPSILIISHDTDFYPVLQEQCELQLGAICDWASDAEDANKKYKNHDIILSDGPIAAAHWPSALLVIGEKPVRLQDLLAEIEALVHKASSPDALALSHGYVLTLQSKQLRYDPSGKMVDITDKEMQLLKALAASPAEGISREQLLKDIWGFGDAIDTHTLETHIYRLRSKMKELSGHDDLIEAVNGGYRMKNE
jgi:hypothetical protein